jgi:hypothetical protein
MKRLPIKDVFIGLDDVLYPFINRVQVLVGDNDLDSVSACISFEKGAVGTDGYF